MIVHNICVGASSKSVEVVIESIISIYEGTNKKETTFRGKNRTQNDDFCKWPHADSVSEVACQSIAVIWAFRVIDLAYGRWHL